MTTNLVAKACLFRSFCKKNELNSKAKDWRRTGKPKKFPILGTVGVGTVATECRCDDLKSFPVDIKSHLCFLDNLRITIFSKPNLVNFNLNILHNNNKMLSTINEFYKK